MVDSAVMQGVQRYLRRLNEDGLEISFGVLFGSQCTGRADKWSDIDLLVVSPEFDGEISRDDVNRLWRMAARTDSRIEPVPCGWRQWREDDASAVIEMARRQGSRVSVACND